MNDFTKDELEELYFYTTFHKDRYQVEYPKELLKKIQSLIENYCEHDWRVNFNEREYSECIKCGEEGI
jgi:hypothetical protein